MQQKTKRCPWAAPWDVQVQKPSLHRNLLPSLLSCGHHALWWWVCHHHHAARSKTMVNPFTGQLLEQRKLRPLRSAFSPPGQKASPWERRTGEGALGGSQGMSIRVPIWSPVRKKRVFLLQFFEVAYHTWCCKVRYSQKEVLWSWTWM